MPVDHATVHAGFRDGWCAHCGGRIDVSWTSTDETFREFFGQLEDLPGVPDWFTAQVARRERAGRDEFGHEFLGRENPLEAIEEAADFALYIRLHLLRCRREGREENIPKALTACRLVARAAQLAAELQAEAG